MGEIGLNIMNWKSFFKYNPKFGERILIIVEWGCFDFKLHQNKKCWAVYECNFKSNKWGTVNLVNLKHIDGEKFDNFEKTQHIGANALHWARLD